MIDLIVVNARTPDHAERLLREVEGASDRIILIDMAPIRAIEAGEKVEIVTLPRLVSYAEAVNIGFARTRSDIFAVLNSDIEIREGSFDDIAWNFEIDKVGIVGPRLVDPDGALQASTHGDLTPAKLALQYLPRVKYLARLAARGVSPAARPGRGLFASIWPHNERREVDTVTGAAFLARRETFIELGGMDETFPFGHEDADLCRRARLRGWKVVFDPGMTLTHHLGASRRAAGVGLEERMAESRIRYAERWFGPLNRLETRLILALASAFGILTVSNDEVETWRRIFRLALGRGQGLHP